MTPEKETCPLIGLTFKPKNNPDLTTNGLVMVFSEARFYRRSQRTSKAWGYMKNKRIQVVCHFDLRKPRGSESLRFNNVHIAIRCEISGVPNSFSFYLKVTKISQQMGGDLLNFLGCLGIGPKLRGTLFIKSMDFERLFY